MKFSGELTVAAAREQVFEKLHNAQFFASCVHGVDDLNELAPDRSATFETKVSFMRFKFQVEVEITRAEKPHLIEAKIEGKPLGIVGRLRRLQQPLEKSDSRQSFRMRSKRHWQASSWAVWASLC